MNKKKIVVFATLLLAATVSIAFLMPQRATSSTMTVYKTPTCGCCGKWVKHMEAAGFTVEVKDLQQLNTVKQRYGVKRSFASCHTAFVDGYVVEGHVPAQFVHRLLEERPAVAGLAVPGMPIGSPGMEGTFSEAYDVLTFDATGATAVYAHVPGD